MAEERKSVVFYLSGTHKAVLDEEARCGPFGTTSALVRAITLDYLKERKKIDNNYLPIKAPKK